MVSSLTERGGAAHQRRFCSQAGKEVHSQWLTLNETHGGDSIHQEGFRVFTQRMWHKQEDEESWDSHAVERRQREKALGPPRNHAKRPWLMSIKVCIAESRARLNSHMSLHPESGLIWSHSELFYLAPGVFYIHGFVHGSWLVTFSSKLGHRY